MPHKKKAKCNDKQRTLDSSLHLQSSNSTQLVLPEISGPSTPEVSQTHRGSLESWHAFKSLKYKNKHDWLVVKLDGIYCRYCSTIKPRVQSGSTVFISQPFTGTRPDKLV